MLPDTSVHQWFDEVVVRVAEHPVVAAAGVAFTVWALTRIARGAFRILGELGNWASETQAFIIAIIDEAKDFVRHPGSPRGLDFLVILVFAAPFLLTSIAWAAQGVLDRVLDKLLGARSDLLYVIVILASLLASCWVAKTSFEYLGGLPRPQARRGRKR